MTEYHPPMETQFFEIFWLDQQVWGVPIGPKPFNQYREEYDYCFNFPGQTVCFFFVTRDYDIRREEALEFAKTIAAKRFVCVNVDLSSVNKAAELRNPNWRRLQTWGTDYVQNVDV